MFLFKKNYRFDNLIAIILYAIISISYDYALAYDENYIRNVNERLQSIASGKIKLDKSSYSVASIRFSTPNPALLLPQSTSKNFETISPKKLIKLRFSPLYYQQKKFGKQIKRGTYASNSKGRAKSFNIDTNGIKRFCNTNATTHFCIREGMTTIRYMGNTPRKHAREIDYSDKNIFHKRQESKKFAQQLLKQPNR